MRKIITVAAAVAGTLLAAPDANADPDGAGVHLSVLSQFPPPAQGTNPDGSPAGGQLYQLSAPITLRLPGAGPAGQQFAQLQGMNINVGKLLEVATR